MAMGDAAMYGALAGSVLFSLSPDAQRPKVLLYLLVSVAPFAVVAPAIGPTLDRIPGGRRFVMQVTAVTRAVCYVVMAFHVDDVLLYPMVFGALVMQKTYAVSKSALVPSVVRNDAELVEANSKLGLISGVVGAIVIGPLALLGKIAAGVPLTIGVALFAVAAVLARRLPKEAVAQSPVEPRERVELRSSGIVLGASAMALLRASLGFLTFHLFFWLREDFSLFHVGLAAAASTVGSMLGNTVAPVLRRSWREEVMFTVALSAVAAAGVGAAVTGGLLIAVVLAFTVSAMTSLGRMAFDSIVQRDAPDANQGRAFARFEARFQLAWVLAGLPPVAFTMPGQAGFLVVGLFGTAAVTLYVIGSRAVRAGRPLPPSLVGLARREVERRRGRRPTVR